MNLLRDLAGEAESLRAALVAHLLPPTEALHGAWRPAGSG